jgi:hypothetical protein
MGLLNPVLVDAGFVLDEQVDGSRSFLGIR